MARHSPLHADHQRAHAPTLAYGPAGPDGRAVEVVATFGDLGAEYAAIRTGCALIDQPQRAMLELRGAERVEFLNRMITQELKGLTPRTLRRGFWLNLKGRIEADLRILHLADRTLLELDVLAAPGTAASLGKYIITEDVTIADLTDRTHRLSLHGPAAGSLLAAVADATDAGSGDTLRGLAPGGVCECSLAGASCLAWREDIAGVPGYEVLVPVEQAAGLYQTLLEAPGHAAMPAGWLALNIARIEAGTPIFNLDFGTSSLPAETGVLDDRVSFTKGCYLGQEIVARMHARGHPKQVLVAIAFASVLDPNGGLPRLPETGATLSLAGSTEVIGQVTSSTLSPLRASSPIGFAMVRYAHRAAGTVLTTVVEGVEVKGVIQEGLSFRAGASRGG
jgi:folate-binding protein YgfZ